MKITKEELEKMLSDVYSCGFIYGSTGGFVEGDKYVRPDMQHREEDKQLIIGGYLKDFKD